MVQSKRRRHRVDKSEVSENPKEEPACVEDTRPSIVISRSASDVDHLKRRAQAPLIVPHPRGRRALLFADPACQGIRLIDPEKDGIDHLVATLVKVLSEVLGIAAYEGIHELLDVGEPVPQ